MSLQLEQRDIDSFRSDFTLTAFELNDTDYQLIARQLSGESSAVDAAELERRLSDPAFAGEFERLQGVWRGAGRDVQVDVNAAYAIFVNKLHTERHSNVVPIGSGVTRRWWRSSGAMLKAAAVLTIVAASAAAIQSLTSNEPGQVVASGAEGLVSKAAEWRSELLPDGSKVVLAPGSRLVTRDGFGAGAREVELSGEASFTVVHDESRPFRVFARGVLIEDLGTVFVVRAREEEPVRVAVSEGSVSLSRRATPDQDRVVLAPSDLAVIADTGDAVVTRKTDVSAYTEWTEGKVVLSFDDVPLRSAAAEISRWYDVEFDVPDDLRGRRVTAPLWNLSIDEVLQVLGTALDVRFEREGRRVRVAATERSELTPSAGRQVGRGM